jgi:methylglyoxal synthase
MNEKMIALIAHDRCKEAMIAFAREHTATLKQHPLVATRTTGTLLNETLALNVKPMLSGPLGAICKSAQWWPREKLQR